MAYSVRRKHVVKQGGGVEETFVTDTIIVYTDTVAEAILTGMTRLKVTDPDDLMVDEIDAVMGDEVAAGARELYPGQAGDQGMVANITDKMRGASQTKVYGSG